MRLSLTLEQFELDNKKSVTKSGISDIQAQVILANSGKNLCILL